MPSKNEEQVLDRGGYVLCTASQLERLADAAAEKAIDKLYASIGKNVVRKLVFSIGAVGAALAAWLNDWVHFGVRH